MKNLKILFGANAESEIVFQEQLESANYSLPEVDYLEADINLLFYKLQLEQSDYKISQQRSDWYPKLNLITYFGAQQYNDQFGVSFKNNSWSKVSYLSLNLSIPIFNGLYTKNRVNSAKIEYDIRIE